MDHLGHALAQAGIPGGQGVRGDLLDLLRLAQGPAVPHLAHGHVRLHQAAVIVSGGHGEEVLVAAAPAIQLPQQAVQRPAEIVPGGGDSLPAAGFAQLVKQDPCGVHHQLFLQGGHDAAPQAALFAGGVVHVPGLDDGPVPAQGPAQQIVRRHVVIVARPGHEGQARLPDAVFIVAQQGLADAQLRRRLPLGNALLLPQQAQRAGKISCHSLSPIFFYTVSRLYRALYKK